MPEFKSSFNCFLETLSRFFCRKLYLSFSGFEESLVLKSELVRVGLYGTFVIGFEVKAGVLTCLTSSFLTPET